MRASTVINHVRTLLGDPHGDYHQADKMLLHSMPRSKISATARVRCVRRLIIRSLRVKRLMGCPIVSLRLISLVLFIKVSGGNFDYADLGPNTASLHK